MFYKYTTDIAYITESGRKKNKQERTWVSFKCKKGEVLALFWHSAAIASVYPNEIPTQLPGTLTHPLELQQPSLSDRRLSLTVTNSHLLTAPGPYLSSSSSGLVGNLARKPFV